MYICIYVHMCICTYTYVYMYICIGSACIYSLVVYLVASFFVCLFVCSCVCLFVCVCVLIVCLLVCLFVYLLSCLFGFCCLFLSFIHYVLIRFMGVCATPPRPDPLPDPPRHVPPHTIDQNFNLHKEILYKTKQKSTENSSIFWPRDFGFFVDCRLAGQAENL